MKRILFFLTLVSQTVFVFSQKENAETVFHRSIEKSLELIDNRKLDSAQIFLDESAQLLTKQLSDSSFYFTHQVAQGALTMRRGDNQTALGVFLKALPYFEKVQNQEKIALTLYQLGICNYFLNRRSVAEDYFIRASGLNTYLSKRIQTKVLQNLGTIYLEEGMARKDSILFLKSVDNYKKASQIYLEENQFSELSLCLSLLGESYMQLEDYGKALEVIDQAVGFAEQDQNDDYIAFALIKKNSILNIQKSYTEALDVILKAIRIYEKSEDNSALLYAYQQKKKSLDHLNRFEASSQLSDSIWGVTVEIYNERIADGIAEIETKYKTAEKEKEIAEQQIEIKNRNIFALILGGSVIILGIIIVGLYKRHQFKQKQFQKEMDLKDALSQIKTQNRLQEQRLEISKDLHDNIGAQLTFIISSIDNLKHISKETSEVFKEKLTSISEFTGETIGQLRDTIWAMNKNEISFEEFYARVLSYIEKIKSVKPDLDFQTTNNIQDNVIFSSVEGMNLFRVLQEAINNTIKHAEASRIELEFSQDKKHLSFSIKDDGKGFELTQVEAGNGLANIEDRASQIGAKVFINSQVEGGTQITLRLDR